MKGFFGKKEKKQQPAPVQRIEQPVRTYAATSNPVIIQPATTVIPNNNSGSDKSLNSASPMNTTSQSSSPNSGDKSNAKKTLPTPPTKPRAGSFVEQVGGKSGSKSSIEDGMTADERLIYELCGDIDEVAAEKKVTVANIKRHDENIEKLNAKRAELEEAFQKESAKAQADLRDVFNEARGNIKHGEKVIEQQLRKQGKLPAH
jgi:hypothetical protein